MPQIQRILVPVDFSPSSRAALDHAMLLAERFGATVLVLHSWDIPGYLHPDLTVWSGEVSVSLMDHARRDSLRAMKEFLHDAQVESDPRVRSRVVSGAAFTAVMQAIEEDGCDLVVMGTHGRTGLSHLVMGSVAEKVVRHAPCPVMTVRAAPEPAAPVPAGAGSASTGSANTGSASPGSASTGSANTGSASPGSASTGSVSSGASGSAAAESAASR